MLINRRETAARKAAGAPKGLLSTTALAGLMALATPAEMSAVAQETTAQAGGLEEIVVTSRRRAELLIDVPQQVTVFSAKDIEDAQITSYQDFANLTPNFSSFENFRRGVFNITVRGIPTVQGGEPPVTILVDGVQVSGLDFVNQDLFDLESIEVLRGPQGAVYGRGAIGGAILMTTRQPSDEMEARAQAIYTSEIDEYRLTGSVSGPVVEDTAYFRLSASHADRDGFIENSLAGGKCDFAEETIFRGALTLKPTDALTINAKAGYLNGDTGASCMNFSYDADPFLNNGKDFAEDLPRDFKQFDDRDIQDYSFKIDYETGAGVLTSVTSYQKSDSFSPGDTDFGPVIQPVFFENPVIVESINTDLHFVSEPTDSFSWIAGAYYQDRDTRNLLRVGLGPLPLEIEPFFVNSNQKDISKAWALYGEATYLPTEDLEISVAMRYDEDKRESEDLNAAGSYIEKTFTAFQPRGSIKYKWDEDLMTYITVGKGFRSGGFNALADIIAVGLTDRLFEKETATTYEAGMKGTFADGKVNVNLALFRTDFKNQQFYFVDVVNVARVVLNFPETRINGAELEINATPVEGLDLQAILGIADGEITKGTPQAPKGNSSPNAHKYTFNLNAQYILPVSNDFDLRTRVEYERRGPIHYDASGNYKFGSTDFFNAYLALETESWSFGVFGKNLSDERIPTWFGVDGGGDGVHQFIQNLPRRFGAEVRVTF